MRSNSECHMLFYLMIDSLTFSKDHNKSNAHKSNLFPWERLSLSWGQGKVKNVATPFQRVSWRKPKKTAEKSLSENTSKPKLDSNMAAADWGHLFTISLCVKSGEFSPKTEQCFVVLDAFPSEGAF